MCSLTFSDIEFINEAMQRKFDLNRKFLHEKLSVTPLMQDLPISENHLSYSFISESLHQPLENVNGKTISKLHNVDHVILICDLNSYLRFVFHHVAHIPWYTNERNMNELSSSRNSLFKRFNRMLSLEDYKYAMSSILLKVLKKIVPRQRLTWVISLLINFHYGHECRIFMSIALKLFLSAFQFFPFSFYVTEMYKNLQLSGSNGYIVATRTIVSCLRIIQRNQCCDNTLITKAFEIFYYSPNMNKFFLEAVPDLEYILESFQDNKMGPPDFLNCHELGRLKSFDLCLLVNLKNFVSLVKYGASSVYTKEDWEIIKRRGIHQFDFKLINVHATVPAYGRFSLRLNQVVRFFEKIKSNRLSPGEAEFGLKLLWASIPDPYLTLEEVEKYLEESINFIEFCQQIDNPFFYSSFFLHQEHPDVPTSECLHRETVNKSSKCYVRFHKMPPLAGTSSALTTINALQWYNRVLEIGDNPTKSPRSLLHLSRCVVRHSLAMNFQLPNGILLLNLPKKIVNYLFMKDCGSNPYEEEYYMNEKIIWLYENVS